MNRCVAIEADGPLSEYIKRRLLLRGQAEVSQVDETAPDSPEISEVMIKTVNSVHIITFVQFIH